jgi:hypothetical protein
MDSFRQTLCQTNGRDTLVRLSSSSKGIKDFNGLNGLYIRGRTSAHLRIAPHAIQYSVTVTEPSASVRRMGGAVGVDIDIAVLVVEQHEADGARAEHKAEQRDEL